MNEPNVGLRQAVKYLVDHGADKGGNLTQLGVHFGVSRQRVHQIAAEMRRKKLAQRPSLSSLAVGGLKERVSA